MNTLRWILLILGVVILFAIYWYDRKRRPVAHRRLLDEVELATEPPAPAALEADAAPVRREPRFGVGRIFGSRTEDIDESEETEKREPVFQSARRSHDGLAASPDVAPAHSPPRRQAAPPRPVPEDRLVVLHVKPANGDAFAGEDLAQAFAESELQYGEMQVFQRTVKFAGKDEVLFRVASMVKPGIFDLSRLRDQRTPGLALFMQLPGPMEGVKAFNTMLHCAQELATRLGGDVLDQTREPLEQPTIDRMRGEIQLFGLQRRQAGLDD